MKVMVGMESNGRTWELLGHGSTEFNPLHVVAMRKNGGSEADPRFWLMNWVDGSGIHGSRSRWKKGSTVHSMHSTLSHRELQGTLKGRRRCRVGEEEKRKY